MRVCLIFLMLCLASGSYAQDSTVFYKTSFALSGATDQTPFWVRANQNGNIPLEGNFAFANLGIYKRYDSNHSKLLQWSAGAEVAASYSTQTNLFFSDLYVTGKIGILEVLAGQKNGVTGLMDTTLTSGSLSVAGNARPFPRLQLAVPDYYPLHFTKDLVSFKLSYSDGFIGPSEINYGIASQIPRTYFHQKTFYLKFGNAASRLHVYTGFNHQAMWGGEAKITPLYNLAPLKAYWYTVTGKTFHFKKIGNHFGTVDIAGEWKGRNWSYFVYRQNIYETGSLFRIINYQDGLNGLRIRRNKPYDKQNRHFVFTGFLLEVLGTNNQINRSPFEDQSVYENGDYYNSYIYRRGWSYKGKEIGTPLIPESGTTKKNLPRNDSEFTNNNHLWAFHSGFTAIWLRTSLRFKGTYSRNNGSLLGKFDSTKQQISLILSAEKKLKILKECSIYSSISCDIGELYPNSYGLLIGFRKAGFLD
ncbi:capsule assembly Wzi family protein [Dyadobacter flavalbus]|nr:capsule assembly Wzi family protein [Dyadobacter flavalbus]